MVVVAMAGGVATPLNAAAGGRGGGGGGRGGASRGGAARDGFRGGYGPGLRVGGNWGWGPGWGWGLGLGFAGGLIYSYLYPPYWYDYSIWPPYEYSYVPDVSTQYVVVPPAVPLPSTPAPAVSAPTTTVTTGTTGRLLYDAQGNPIGVLLVHPDGTQEFVPVSRN